MQQALIERLNQITDEEKRILEGSQEIDKEYYATGKDFTVVDSNKMLEEGQLISIRKHTRFVNFPSHRHNYVEMIFVVQGQVVNFIGDREIVVEAGEILLLNQFTKHAIKASGKEDLAINFIILPEFLDVASTMVGKGNVLADFLVNILRQNQEKGEYLHFRVSQIPQIQNLMENMIISLLSNSQNNLINQTTMGLLFMHLVDSASYVEMRIPNHYDEVISLSVLNYIEYNYRTATLSELSLQMHLPLHTLSKMIKASTGFNFKELLMRKRLNKAVHLLCDTDLPVNDVIAAVGYENNSYFHRIFREHYGMTPHQFRKKNKENPQILLTPGRDPEQS